MLFTNEYEIQNAENSDFLYNEPYSLKNITDHFPSDIEANYPNLKDYLKKELNITLLYSFYVLIYTLPNKIYFKLSSFLIKEFRPLPYICEKIRDNNDTIDDIEAEDADIRKYMINILSSLVSTFYYEYFYRFFSFIFRPILTRYDSVYKSRKVLHVVVDNLFFKKAINSSPTKDTVMNRQSDQQNVHYNFIYQQLLAIFYNDMLFSALESQGGRDNLEKYECYDEGNEDKISASNHLIKRLSTFCYRYVNIIPLHYFVDHDDNYIFSEDNYNLTKHLLSVLSINNPKDIFLLITTSNKEVVDSSLYKHNPSLIFQSDFKLNRNLRITGKAYTDLEAEMQNEESPIKEAFEKLIAVNDIEFYLQYTLQEKKKSQQMEEIIIEENNDYIF
jgi:hypothetical protein